MSVAHQGDEAHHPDQDLIAALRGEPALEAGDGRVPLGPGDLAERRGMAPGQLPGEGAHVGPPGRDIYLRGGLGHKGRAPGEQEPNEVSRHRSKTSGYGYWTDGQS